MSDEPPLSTVPSCLMRTYRANPSQKGGTLILEDVHDPEEHDQRVLDPDGYRPDRCPRCGHVIMHAHDIRSRLRRDQPPVKCHDVRRYVCAECTACWQVLPGFLARHLHRAWHAIHEVARSAGLLAVDDGLSQDRPEESPSEPVPRTTRRRYLSRLSLCASALLSAFALGETGLALGFSGEGEVAEALGRAGFCNRLADARKVLPHRALADSAGWLHRLQPGLRLM